MMKRLTILMLLMVSTPLFAEWTAVGGSTDQTAYVDLATIRKQGSKVKIWHLLDFKTAIQIHKGDEKYLSMISLSQFDCEEETDTPLGLSLYSGKMGRGKVIYTDSVKDEPAQIPPGSIIQIILKIACGKR
jgi:hypothetical protein